MIVVLFKIYIAIILYETINYLCLRSNLNTNFVNNCKLYFALQKATNYIILTSVAIAAKLHRHFHPKC